MWAVQLCLTALIAVVTSRGSLTPSFTLTTKLGTITGTRETLGRTGYSKFLGIPFGTANRFEKPQAYGPFGTLRATTYGPSCPQMDSSNNMVGSEDGCLTLNIFTPKFKQSQRKLRSVMIWFAGGAFVRAKSAGYPADILAARNGVVVVTFNYRVGPFGFLSSGSSDLPGNYGLWDQQLAVKWVKDNIEDYGGNPDSITLFGQSAGAISITCQMISPQTPKGLFQRVITESGSAFSYQIYTVSPRTTFDSIEMATSCNTSPDPIACLKALPAETLLQVSATANVYYSPVIDSDFMSGQFVMQLAQFIANSYENQTSVALGNFLDYDVLSGWNSQDGLYGMSALNAINMLAAGSNISQGIANPILKFSLNRVTGGILDEQGGLLIGLLVQHYMNDPRPWLSDGRSVAERRVEAFGEILGDVFFKLPAITHLQLHSLLSSRSTYAYEYQHKRAGRGFSFEGPEWLRDGANHFDEVPYVFGAPLAPIEKCSQSITLECGQYTRQEKILSLLMMHMWTTFAKTGKLSGGLPQFDFRGDQKYIVLDTYNPFKRRGIHVKTYPLSSEHRFMLTLDALALAVSD